MATEHQWHPESHPDIPFGLNGEKLVGWECPACTLFVMTQEGTTPTDAPRIYVSCGSFGPTLWHRWPCTPDNKYQIRD
jgi:hypothetical protein